MFSGAPDKGSTPCSQEISKFVIVHTLIVYSSHLPGNPAEKEWEKWGTESWSGDDTRHRESEDTSEQT